VENRCRSTSLVLAHNTSTTHAQRSATPPARVLRGYGPTDIHGRPSSWYWVNITLRIGTAAVIVSWRIGAAVPPWYLLTTPPQLTRNEAPRRQQESSVATVQLISMADPVVYLNMYLTQYSLVLANSGWKSLKSINKANVINLIKWKLTWLTLIDSLPSGGRIHANQWSF